MNRILLYVLLPLICFNLAGGFGMAAGFSNSQSLFVAQDLPAQNPEQETVTKKEVTIVAALTQIFKEADEGASHHDALVVKTFACPLPEVFFPNLAKGFGIQHYLSLYDRTIKVRQPQVYLKDCVFLI